MKVRTMYAVAGVLIATLIIFAGCADSLSACPTVDGVEATRFTAGGARGTNGPPYALCEGYRFVKAGCPHGRRMGNSLRVN